jgi:hypothetical protein
MSGYHQTALAFCAAIVMLAACTAPAQVITPSQVPADAVALGRSQDLLYVSDLGANAVYFYTYPTGKLMGKLTGFGSVAGLCADKAGDVFVVDEAGPVDVYAHGGSSPIRRLTTTGAPYGCAVDPNTGNLAVTNLSSVLYGTIAIYAKAKGKPREYPDNAVDSTYFCGYDDNGNLFIDGWNRSAQFILLELPKGGRGFRTYMLTRTVEKPGGVQWDGKYVAIGDQGAGLIYRAGSTGKVAQTVTLKKGANVEQFWIAGTTLIGPNAQSGGTVPFWRYPAGGSPTKTINGFLYPVGVTVSPAKSL